MTLVIDADPGNELCVVDMLNNLREMNPSRFSGAAAHLPFFRTWNGRVLHKHKVQDLLKGSAARFGFDPKDFTSHSLRAGGASAMYHNHFTQEEIQRRGRWVSDVWKIYIQGNSEGAAEMTKRMTQHSTLLHERLKTAWK